MTCGTRNRRLVFARRHAAAGQLLLLLLSLSCISLSAQPRPQAVEREVQAAFLYQFARYVDWPVGSDDNAPFAICVFGEDPFGSVLDDMVKDRTIAGRRVAIRRIVGPTEMSECRILFVSRSADGRLPSLLKALEGKQVLTVGEGAQFTRRGGMVAFTSEDRKVRFVINLGAAGAAKLMLSSQLLRIAARVEQ